MSSTTARLLLHSFHWDTVRLTEKWFDSDSEKLFRDAKVVNPRMEQPPVPSPIVRDGREECGVCFLGVPSEEMFSLNCAHRFCKVVVIFNFS